MLPLSRIAAAAQRAAPHVRRTPLLELGRDRIHLKAENLQAAGSFKVRGFFAAALALPEDVRARGLLTVSAGNAALACAHVARALGLSCRVVMFDTAPAPKLEGVRALGATPVLMRRSDLLDWMGREGWNGEPEVFIHPFADDEVMAGHGGAGLEIAEQLPDVARVVVPVGGGGLCAGIAAALKQSRPGVEVVGVQSSGYALWPRTFAERTPPSLMPDTIADGTTAPWTEKMSRVLAGCVDRWVVVPEPRLRVAVAELAAAAKLVAEGAGALAFAALEQLEPGAPTVAVVSGGNIAPSLLADLISR